MNLLSQIETPPQVGIALEQYGLAPLPIARRLKRMRGTVDHRLADMFSCTH